MKTNWLQHSGDEIPGCEPNGCYLNEHETDLLIRLAEKLSRDLLYSKGFSDAEASVIQKWAYAI